MDGTAILIVIVLIIGIAFVGTVCSEKDRKDRESDGLRQEQEHKRLAGKDCYDD